MALFSELKGKFQMHWSTGKSGLLGRYQGVVREAWDLSQQS
jgi:hypothetical protein